MTPREQTLEHECARLTEELALARAAMQWQPIETAPRDGARILLGREAGDESDGHSTVGWWQKAVEDGVDYMGADAGFVDCDFQLFCPGRSFGSESHRYTGSLPTKWMPLPPPPIISKST